MSAAACEWARDRARLHKGWAGLTAEVNDQFGLTLTPGAMRSRYDRWRVKSGAPSLFTAAPANEDAERIAEWAEDVPTVPGVPPVEHCAVNPVVEAERAAADPDKPAVIPPPPRPLPEHFVRVEPPPEGLVICSSDHHHNINDPVAEAALMAFARDRRPRAWVFNGDCIDAFWLSRHTKEAGRIVAKDAGSRVVDEVNSFRPYVQGAAECSDHVYVGEGNHERNLRDLIDANPGLHGLPGLSWREIFALPENCTVMDYGYRLRMGPMSFVHGDRIGNSKFGVKHPSAWVLDNYGARNLAFGHTHRTSCTYRTTYDEDGTPSPVVALNNGLMADYRKMHYAGPEPNWQQGFLAIEWWTMAGKPRFNAYLVCIVDGRFNYGGRVYDGRKWQ